MTQPTVMAIAGSLDELLTNRWRSIGKVEAAQTPGKVLEGDFELGHVEEVCGVGYAEGCGEAKA